ncbi:MAG: response regulator [Chitinophagaceae bacterium]
MDNNLRLLIVDDDPDDREFFIEAIKDVDETIECITASNGIQALEWLRDTGHPLPDLIFLDISMPLLNGRNCLAEIKKDQRLLTIPVIIYTTSKDIDESRELKKMGALHFMTKPRDAEEIYYPVAVVLEEYLFSARNK